MSRKQKISKTYNLDPTVAKIITEFAHVHPKKKTQSGVIEDLVMARAKRFMLDDRVRYTYLRELSQKLLS